MDDEKRRELQEHAHRLRELQQHPGWALLVMYARKRVDPFQRDIIGGIDDHGRYMRLAGWCAGALEVLEIPDRVNREVR